MCRVPSTRKRFNRENLSLNLLTIPPFLAVIKVSRHWFGFNKQINSKVLIYSLSYNATASSHHFIHSEWCHRPSFCLITRVYSTMLQCNVHVWCGLDPASSMCSDGRNFTVTTQPPHSTYYVLSAIGVDSTVTPLNFPNYHVVSYLP